MNTIPLEKAKHDRNRFDCGITELNNYLKVMASETVAFPVVIVDVKDDADHFYEKYGFTPPKQITHIRNHYNSVNSR